MHASDRGQAKDGNGLTVAVVGGGITGLAAAWQLVTTLPRGARVVLLEADERLGGKLLTGEIGGRPVDLGPDAFLARRPEAAALCHDLGLGADLVPPGASGAFVWARGALRQLPSGLALGLPTRMGPLARSGICSPMGLGRAALDLLRPSAPPRRKSAGEAQDDNDDDYDESVGSVVRRRLGTEVHDLLADPLIGGIHAGPIDTMSAAAVFPALLRAERQPGSLMKALRPMAPPPAPRPERRAVPPLAATGDLRAADAPAPSERAPVFLTVRGGLGRIVERSEQELTARGADIRVGVRVENIHMSTTTPGPPRWSITTSRGTLEVDGVVVAVPATAASGLLGRLDPSLAGLLSGIPYGSVTLVTLRFPKSALRFAPRGTGFLVPAGRERLVTACTWVSSKWPELDRRDDVLLRASMGRYGDDRSSSMSDDEAAACALKDLHRMVDLRGEPAETVVTRWPASFPQYLVGHLRRVRAVEERAARHHGLALAGAALHGVGIPACVGSGRGAAADLVGRLVPGAGGTR
jgi:oxygen-dependent protoporphyrinogen oxidase